MYWSRTGSIAEILGLLALTCLWAVGGWLLVKSTGRFRRREYFAAGLATGLLLDVLLSNALAHFLPVYPAFVLACAAVLVLGLAAARSSGAAVFTRQDLSLWPQAVALIGMGVLFSLILRGLSTGDDYAHLPLVSVMAAGDVPPHYSLVPDVLLAYHYGLDLFAASLVRIGGLFPWSAWDVSRALALALALLCAWLWIRRLNFSRTAAFVGVSLVAFGMGTRWILTLLPAAWITNISSAIQIIGSSQATGQTLAEALYRPWQIAGGPPIPFPFAFANGILIPLTFAWSGAGALPDLAVVLMLLLAGRRIFRPAGLLCFGIAFLSLALSAEHMFVLIDLSLGLTALFVILRNRIAPAHILKTLPGQFLLIALLGTAASLLQGGTIAVTAQRYLTGQQAVGGGVGLFSPRWPPSFFDAHLGSLSPLNWRQLVVLLAECGPILFLFPLVARRMQADLRHLRLAEFGLGAASFLAVLIPLFLNYKVPRDIVRFTGFGLSVWLLLSIQPLWAYVTRAGLGRKILVGSACAITVFGGLALLVYQCTAILAPTTSYFVTSLDTRMSQVYWNALAPQTLVFDPLGYRAQTLFGRLSIDDINGFARDGYGAYVSAPDPYALHRLGFGYVYVDQQYWRRLSAGAQNVLQAACARSLLRLERHNQLNGALLDFRMLIDITRCQ